MAAYATDKINTLCIGGGVCLLLASLFFSPQNGYARKAHRDTLQAYQFFTGGMELQNKAQYSRSTTLLADAADRYLRAEAWARAALCYNQISKNFRMLSQLKSAHSSAHAALTIARTHLPETRDELIHAYYSLGLTETERSHYDKADRWFTRGIGEAGKKGVSNSIESLITTGLGSLYDDRGQYDQALLQYRKALALLDIHTQSDTLLRSDIYNYMGIVYANKGKFDRALFYYRKELELRESRDQSVTPNIAGAYNNIGTIYYRKGDIGEAVRYFKKSARASKRIWGEMHPKIGLLYNNIGACYSMRGNLEEAIRYMQKSVKIKIKTQGADHPDVALGYNNIGGFYAELGDPERAQKYLVRSLEIRKKTLGENHPDLANNYHTLGIFYSKVNNHEKAVSYFKKEIVLTRIRLGNNHPYLAEAHSKIASSYVEQEKYDQALTHFQNALFALTNGFDPADVFQNPPLSSIDYPSSALDILYQKAKTLQRSYPVMKDSGVLVHALSTYKKASELADRLQLEYVNDESKLLVSDESHAISEGAIKTAYKLYQMDPRRKYLEDIFFFSEKSKARVLKELINDQNAKEFAGIPDSMLQYGRNLRQQISAVHHKINGEATRKSDDTSRLDAYKDSLFVLNQRLQEQVQVLENRYPRYYKFKYEHKIYTAKKIQHTLANSGKTIIEYFYGENSLWGIVLSENHIEVHPLPYDSLLSEHVTFLNKAIDTGDISQYKKRAAGLYQTLIVPLAGNLRHNRIHIIPDGILSLLPFEALLSKPAGKSLAMTGWQDLSYMVENYEISYSPSASLAAFEDTERAVRSFASQLIAFAPVFSSDQLSSGNRTGGSVQNRWLPLPSSQYEVEEIASLFEDGKNFWESLFGGSDSDIYMSDEATESAFKSTELSRYRFIHLATHAFTAADGKESSGIVFYDESNRIEDGVLYAHEIYNLKLQAELVVLSACDTGTGKVARGEGIIGLSRAFQYAGAQNLLSSLWSVDDRSAAQLMVSFYKHRLEGATLSSSLREAKLKLLDHPKYANPRYWAPFILLAN